MTITGQERQIVSSFLKLATCTGWGCFTPISDTACQTRAKPFSTIAQVVLCSDDWISGNCELSEALIQTSIPNLLVLPAGQGGPHVPELFSSNQMAMLMSEMTHRFGDRYIIIDTPPCMASSDAAALAPLVGQIVFIVEAHHTQQMEIESSLSMLSACPRISLLLNKSDTMSGEYFGSYNYYYHYYNSQCRQRDVPRSDNSA